MFDFLLIESRGGENISNNPININTWVYIQIKPTHLGMGSIHILKP